MRYILLIVLFFMFKAGKAINRFDISEGIGHSHKQVRKEHKDGSDRQ
jgi:hypothetical protein